MNRWGWLGLFFRATDVHAGQDHANIYPAGFHAHSDPMEIVADPSAPATEWRVHLGSSGLNKKVTVSAEDIADLEAKSVIDQDAFDDIAADVAPLWYPGLSTAIKARCRWAWANRP